MRNLLAILAAGLCGASCVQMKMTAQGGFTQMAVAGDIALATTSGSLTSTINQDVESAFGLDDGGGSPYARLQLDLGIPVITVSGFRFEEQGSGTLNQQFGNIPASTAVDSNLEFANVKASCAFQIDLGPVALSPGVALDLIDLTMSVRSAGGTEEVAVFAPVPMVFLRGEVDLAVVAGVAELGYVQVPRIEDVEGTFWDAELGVEVRPAPGLHLFAGYRMMHVDGEGTVDNQDFATDLDIAGWMVGGGIRF